MTVFLSHSSRDKAFVRWLTDELRREEIEVWLDEVELRVGQPLIAIEGEIRKARHLVVVLSQASLASDWVKREVDFAQQIGGIDILPLLLEDVPQRWDGALAGVAFADFRAVGDYRNSLSRVLEALDHRSPFLTAKTAAKKVRDEISVAGELFGLSQQGVAMVYSLANRRDWLFADARNGVSRLWIAEFYDHEAHAIRSFAVVRREIHELPLLHLLDADPQPIADSAIVMSCSLNDMPGIPEGEAKAFIESHPSEFQHVSRRYTRFRPAVLTRPFVDSDVAVASALESVCAQWRLDEAREIFTLAKLEIDKPNGNAVLWKVSFFDPTLSESVLTVGVDGMSGKVKYPNMRAEVLNADFFRIREEGEQIVIDLSNQIRAIDSRSWDIAVGGDSVSSRPTAANALRLATDLLGEEAGRFQLAFLSSTGVVRTALSSSVLGADRLMRADGSAGQWVVEVCGTRPTPITEGNRSGFLYDFRQIVVTREEGAVVVDPEGTCVLTVPLSQCPMPAQFLAAYEKAFALALRSATYEFEVLSVAHTRRPQGLAWCFRFYDANEIVEKIWVMGDGSRVLAEP